MSKETISFSGFSKLDIRIGKILKVAEVEGLDKLYKLTVNIGGETKTLLAGLREVYSVVELIGKQIVVVVNLEPKTVKGITSEGMLLAADVNGKPILLQPEEVVPAGTIVR